MKIYDVEEGMKFPKMNLQLFNDNKDDGTPSSDDNNKGGEDNKGTDVDDNKGNDNKDDKDDKTFTQEELDDIIQKRLARERVKIEKEYEDEKKKQERLKDLSDEDREKEKLKIKQEELEEKENELRIKELEMDAKDILIEKELPLEFLDFILGEDAETTKENIDKFDEKFRLAVSEEVKKQISSGGMKRSTSKGNENFGIKLAEESNKVEKKHNFF